ncbi:uncharacterized protein MONOS_18385 [Monocercomonoides exilis]|uniref:uncharacterized protein n=1 Tax=Monocercomonoides exilis TaxID=2049356 RepID=UPI003559FFB7|nr:hypothetical protein MONOS_18385 [Monocercomonoides exilis]
MCWAYGWAGPVAWPGPVPHILNSGVGARAPETKVTVCAQTVAARWAGCCWAPVLADVGRVGVWAAATRLGGGSVVELAGWAVWAGSGLWAVGWAGWVGCALGFVQSLSLKKPQIW